ncbi:MAG: hypothetical protein A3I44_01175 [Candidatus Sungbacteria bacterium RIFCSPLOWO2_02_FULL_51_17]|uniref:Uncharacterized protein n=1 Tax=Candidatus Sungbacteria bacterium RIFCSPHIGHO2_02_FULL_51_29 TaxID=1802273 RepID=A0A1G2KRW6_9BACT|nr:MAG: hypothetical protein A2676_00880 [Candidatus Sungbacteria bacterium RIFCSPHIGHO2_01_FULL_51_22]OHA02187.1 MAG: hypothetical protein A3C16_00675 [Candidatus Sungbacteria bacterium RIFCSPHIGHO2_02_FULL_51_29]OHA07654.1 MAG: hypothetical protein A3B29_05660 [Candidatus Sungbacteria bacterium RIFCSPLOWO2_01_FULL_51_34]OHA10733.1 MAG: hypothetical protein A3I44_01175 [Candidatus Sungbacteria bacterium RIFCSPLOWO2_02_FULL_51_17]
MSLSSRRLLKRTRLADIYFDVQFNNPSGLKSVYDEAQALIMGFVETNKATLALHAVQVPISNSTFEYDRRGELEAIPLGIRFETESRFAPKDTHVHALFLDTSGKFFSAQPEKTSIFQKPKYYHSVEHTCQGLPAWNAVPFHTVMSALRKVLRRAEKVKRKEERATQGARTTLTRLREKLFP